MSSLESFSSGIDGVIRLRSKNRLLRSACRLLYWYRWFKNRPYPFRLAGVGQGQAVGEPIDIFHLRLYDMMEHEACGQLTGKVVLEGMRINAFSVIRFDKLDEMHARTIIQPRWV